MTHLETLKNTIKGLFDKATSKEDIEVLTKASSEVEATEKEFKELNDKHKELLGAYKDVVKNTSFTEKPKEDPVGTQPKAQSLEEALKDFTSDEKNKSYL